ncbi:hypothetical protein BSAF29S_01491 [Bacillus safensis subsp. safensis]
MQLDDLESIPHIIAVAGGSSKAGAIEAYFKKPRRTVLVTDESERIVKALGHEVGKSLLEEDKVELAKSFMDRAKEKGVNFLIQQQISSASRRAFQMMRIQALCQSLKFQVI